MKLVLCVLRKLCLALVISSVSGSIVTGSIDAGKSSVLVEDTQLGKEDAISYLDDLKAWSLVREAAEGFTKQMGTEAENYFDMGDLISKIFEHAKNEHAEGASLEDRTLAIQSMDKIGVWTELINTILKKFEELETQDLARNINVNSVKDAEIIQISSDSGEETIEDHFSLGEKTDVSLSSETTVGDSFLEKARKSSSSKEAFNDFLLSGTIEEPFWSKKGAKVPLTLVKTTIDGPFSSETIDLSLLSRVTIEEPLSWEETVEDSFLKRAERSSLSEETTIEGSFLPEDKVEKSSPLEETTIEEQGKKPRKLRSLKSKNINGELKFSKKALDRLIEKSKRSRN